MSDVLEIERLGVFQVFTASGTGTAFLIDPHTLVTNAHVVEPFRRVAIELRDKRRVVGTIRRVHPRRDLAIVEVAIPLAEDALVVAETDEAQARQAVHIIGFPVGLPLSLTAGVISHPHQLLGDEYFVQTDAAINPGNSGGPILADDKRVIAVTTCKLTSADNVGFGIPASDVTEFIKAYRQQTVGFGVACPSCGALLVSADRYCAACGADGVELGLDAYFGEPELDPQTAFVEQALAAAGVDPVVARHGANNWSFYSGSAAITIWSCSESHLCFAAVLARPGKARLDALFRYLLSAEHAPLVFDLADHLIRLSLTVHVSDLFVASARADLQRHIKTLITSVDRLDNLLIEQYGCEPAPQTQLAVLTAQASAPRNN